jgi:methionine aminotransferase
LRIKRADLYGYKPDANSEVTITAGATEALYAAITALVRPGDEVICFDPSYDSYAPAVELSGGWLNVSRCNRRLFASTGRL